MPHITEVTGGIRVEVRVQPRSSKNQAIGEQNGAWKIKLTAAPVDGEANHALIEFISGYLKVPRKNVTLIKGDTARNKIIEINGITKEEFIKKAGL